MDYKGEKRERRGERREEGTIKPKSINGSQLQWSV
jgi:hypothetical protein